MSQSTNIASIINLGLPAETPDSFKNPEVRGAVSLAIQGINNLLRAIEQYCGVTQKEITQWPDLLPTDTLLRQNLGRLYVKFSENVGFGELVNLYSAAGILNARKSNATAGLVKPARGYCNVSSGVLSGDFGEVILSQGIMIVLGVLPGDSLWLSTTTGAMQNTPSVGAGELEQFIGFGVGVNLAYIDITQGSYLQH